MTFIELLQNTLPVVPDSVPDKEQEIAMLKSLPFDELMDKLIHSMVTFAINLAIAIFVFYLGKFIIAKLYKFVAGIMVKRKADKSLTSFILSLVRMVLYFILIVTVIGIIGIETSSFIAIFASAGVAIGMALSGTLQNFAGGVLILLIKPYKVGDYIEAQGYAGTVKEIQIFHTIILTPDNKSIIIPNGGLSTGSVNNYSRESYRRVDWSVGISYGDDVETARKAILDIFASDERIVEKYIADDMSQRLKEEAAKAVESGAPVDDEPKKRSFVYRMFHRTKHVKSKIDIWKEEQLNQPEYMKRSVDCSPTVVVDQLADSAVVLKARAWTRSDFYWGVYYSVNERIYKELPQAGISFPFPQLDVHLSEVRSESDA